MIKRVAPALQVVFVVPVVSGCCLEMLPSAATLASLVRLSVEVVEDLLTRAAQASVWVVLSIKRADKADWRVATRLLTDELLRLMLDMKAMIDAGVIGEGFAADVGRR
jgi:hypothetical protein